jgi:hypothetical protein
VKPSGELRRLFLLRSGEKKDGSRGNFEDRHYWRSLLGG